jgi:hypothetical protein
MDGGELTDFKLVAMLGRVDQHQRPGSRLRRAQENVSGQGQDGENGAENADDP